MQRLPMALFAASAHHQWRLRLVAAHSSYPPILFAINQRLQVNTASINIFIWI
jgi:hypothetical protein